ncbi:MAG TPA: hypothetical protein VFR81_00550 [Longimicrobium sp.]|nr:hypothetical protein [Longimicrobium sp.]
MANEHAEVLTDREVEVLTAEIERQLREIGPRRRVVYRGGGGEPARVPERQERAVEEVTGQPFRDFFRRFRAAARRDLCREGGILHERWKQVRELSSEERTKSLALVLSALGVIDWKALVVPVVVIVTHLGVETICEESTEA